MGPKIAQTITAVKAMIMAGVLPVAIVTFAEKRSKKLCLLSFFFIIIVFENNLMYYLTKAGIYVYTGQDLSDVIKKATGLKDNCN